MAPPSRRRRRLGGVCPSLILIHLLLSIMSDAESDSSLDERGQPRVKQPPRDAAGPTLAAPDAVRAKASLALKLRSALLSVVSRFLVITHVHVKCRLANVCHNA